MISIPENSEAGDIQANGLDGNAVAEVDGHIRTLCLELGESGGIEIKPEMHIYHWLVRHVGTILTRIKVHSSTGLTAYERDRGSPSAATMAVIGESVLYQTSKKARKKRSEDRFKPGVFLGVAWRSGGSIIGTPDGIVTIRTITRRPKDEQWSKGNVMAIKGTPTDLEGVDFEGHDAEDEVPVPEPPQTEERMRSRSTHIRIADVKAHGATDGCRGCRALLAGKSRAMHSADCRARLEEAMLNDPATASRVKRARDRIQEDINLDREMGEEPEDN